MTEGGGHHVIIVIIIIYYETLVFGALTLLVGWQEGHLYL